MIGTDMKDTNIVNKIEEKSMTSEEKNKAISLLKNCWNSFHKYFVYAIITCLVGIYVGISVSKIYYSDKMKDSILLGGFVFEQKAYTILNK